MPLNNIMDWDKLRIFHAVADAGSFTHAGPRAGPVAVGREPADQCA